MTPVPIPDADCPVVASGSYVYCTQAHYNKRTVGLNYQARMFLRSHLAGYRVEPAIMWYHRSFEIESLLGADV